VAVSVLLRLICDFRLL